MPPKTIVGVIGSAEPSKKGYSTALEVGRLIARRGWVLVCGGLGGVMEAASRGCAEEGGTVLGILPGPERSEANPFVTVPVPTNMGHARNVIIVHCAQALIAVEGEYGTLSEMAVALKVGRPVVSLGGRFPIEDLCRAATPAEAVTLVLDLLGGNGQCNEGGGTP
jgi:uncharacterized protein (TIGR00725 family)